MFTFWQKYMLACVYHQSEGSREATLFSIREVLCPEWEHGNRHLPLTMVRKHWDMVRKHWDSVDWSCILPVESMLVIRQGDQFILESGDRSKLLTEEFLNSCLPEWADTLRQAIERLRSS